MSASKLERSHVELRAAQHLADGGFGLQAVSRAYFAAFFAAEAALLSLGESRSKHAGVIAAFGRLVVLEGGMSSEEGRRLRALFERRGDADYALFEIPDEEVARAIDDATRFVHAVEAWLAAEPDRD